MRIDCGCDVDIDGEIWKRCDLHEQIACLEAEVTRLRQELCKLRIVQDADGVWLVIAGQNSARIDLEVKRRDGFVRTAIAEALAHSTEGRDGLQSLWQPMSTAPRDGTEVLILVERRVGVSGRCLVGHYMPGGHCIEDHPPIAAGWYFWNGSMFDLASVPLAWMPLPDTPALAHTEEQHG